ncbi:hypothetical protein Bca52824_057764 [Brassica carinata]|uniref:Uncharacterized protein n=1 Tax=Brassica carinata TaxID=52824 RepID=A0A8X7QR17_BRACI|nr:hypothetical protein Bca52824_057764 [Brassica carinata]
MDSLQFVDMLLIGSTVPIQSHQSEIYCYPRRTAMLGSLSWISPHHLLVQCKAYEVVVGIHTMNVIDATILPKVGFYGSTNRARKVTTAVCESEVAINQALHIAVEDNWLGLSLLLYNTIIIRFRKAVSLTFLCVSKCLILAGNGTNVKMQS